MTKEHGTMDFDFRRRCVAVVPQIGDVPEHQVVFYGLTAVDIVGIRPVVFDMASPYADLSEGGRTRPIEEEYKTRKHFFNKRIMTREESIGGQTVQSGRDAGRVRAHDGVAGESRAAEVAPAEGGVGSGDQDSEGEVI